MGKFFFTVNSNAVEGKDDEYNDWYSNTHLSDILKLRGFTAAQRFKAGDALDAIKGKPPEHKYLAIYEMETDDLQGCLAELFQAVESMDISDAFDSENVSVGLFAPITDRVTE